MRSNQGRDSWSVGQFERRAILGTRAPVEGKAQPKLGLKGPAAPLVASIAPTLFE